MLGSGRLVLFQTSLGFDLYQSFSTLQTQISAHSDIAYPGVVASFQVLWKDRRKELGLVSGFGTIHCFDYLFFPLGACV